VLLTPARAQNIEGGGRRRRLLFGGAMLALAVAGLLGMLAAGAGRGARLVVFVPLWIGALGLSQAATGT
jgi:hypothetical protein